MIQPNSLVLYCTTKLMSLWVKESLGNSMEFFNQSYPLLTNKHSLLNQIIHISIKGIKWKLLSAAVSPPVFLLIYSSLRYLRTLTPGDQEVSKAGKGAGIGGMVWLLFVAYLATKDKGCGKRNERILSAAGGAGWSSNGYYMGCARSQAKRAITRFLAWVLSAGRRQILTWSCPVILRSLFRQTLILLRFSSLF